MRKENKKFKEIHKDDKIKNLRKFIRMIEKRWWAEISEGGDKEGSGKA